MAIKREAADICELVAAAEALVAVLAMLEVVVPPELDDAVDVAVAEELPEVEPDDDAEIPPEVDEDEVGPTTYELLKSYHTYFALRLSQSKTGAITFQKFIPEVSVPVVVTTLGKIIE